MTLKIFCVLNLCLVLTLISACGKQESKDVLPPNETSNETPLEKVFVNQPLDKTLTVLGARQVIENGKEITVRGRIKDWTQGFAQFTLVDESFKPCSEMGDADTCKTPWDYCCTDTSELAGGTLTIEIRDGKDPVAAELKGIHGFDHLKTLSARGRMEIRDGQVVLMAEALYVHR